MSKKIAVLVGSLRKESLNRKLANVLKKIAPASLNLELITLGDLPLYNQDLDDEKHPPATWTSFRQQLKACDGFLFVTPEYNRSVPGVLKNAIDVGSRPYGDSVWAGKPAAVISLSVGAVGGFGANHHLRQSLVTLNVPTMPGPEVYIGNASQLFNDKGDITNQDVQGFVKKFIDTYADWVKLLSS